MASPDFSERGDSSGCSSRSKSPLGGGVPGQLYPPSVVGPAYGRLGDSFTPVTHSSMLSSRQWPADEPRTLNALGTPTKRPPEKSYLERSEVVGLDMSSYRIRNLAPTICRFTFLTELRLANNFLTRLPSGIGHLRSLAFLDLSNNQLSELPPEMGWLCCLKELLLFNNHLQDFPGELGYLYQLENFGIDGNPINESLLQVVHNQGALAIIPFLRDHVITVVPPTDRSWQSVEPSSFTTAAKSSVMVLCYNVLCDKYATPQMFGYVPSWFLNWDYRKQLILHEILSYDADIVCLQEVETSQYEQYFKPQLRMRGGYDGVFSPKSRARTMSDWDKSFVDGCATFFKADKFKLEDKTLVEFNQTALARPSLRKHKDVYNRVMTRDNISVLVRLEHKESRQELIVGNVHIHWDPSYRDVKLLQTIMLVEELEKMSVMHPKAAIVVCGDFNSLPGSGVCTFLETGSVAPNHADFMEHTYEPYTTEGAFHSLGLRNAYSSAPDPMTFTSFTPMFLGVIDYIWFRPGILSVSGSLGPIPTDYARQIVGMPSQHLPSDHVSLLAEFRIENASQGGFASNAFVGRKEAAAAAAASQQQSGGGLKYSTSNSEMAGSSRRLFSRNKNAMR